MIDEVRHRKVKVKSYKTISQRYSIPLFRMKGDGVQAREKKIEMECVKERWKEGLGLGKGNGKIRKYDMYISMK